MEHEVANVGLLSLVHHVVMLVNMENVRWRDVVCLPSLPPLGKCVIVMLHNYRHRTGCPVEKLLETVSGIGYLIEVIEVDIKNGVHRLLSSAEQCNGLSLSLTINARPLRPIVRMTDLTFIDIDHPPQKMKNHLTRRSQTARIFETIGARGSAWPTKSGNRDPNPVIFRVFQRGGFVWPDAGVFSR